MIEQWGAYTQPELVWKGIPGFFDFQDVYDEIADWAKDGFTLVEVGSFLGRSACYLGEQLQARGKRVTLICVDTWPAAYNWGPEHLPRLVIESPFETFYANVRQSGLLGTIVPIRAASAWAAQFIKDGLDFVYIDAGHEYSDVANDISVWLPKVRSGGILAGHDYNLESFPRVVQAVNESFGPDRREIRGASWIVRL